MNRLRNQSFGAVLRSPLQYMPATVQLHPDLLQQHSVVQGLRDALYSAISEIKSLKEQNKSLEEKMDLQQTEWKQVEMQLKEELRQKDELLKKCIRKRRARTKAHVDTLCLHAQKEREMERREKEWMARFGGLVTTLQELGHREEAWSSQEQLEQEEENKSQEEATIQHKEENKSQEEATIQHEEEESESQDEREEAKITEEEAEEERTKIQTEKKNNHYEKVKEERKTTHHQQMDEKNKSKAKKNRG